MEFVIKFTDEELEMLKQEMGIANEPSADEIDEFLRQLIYGARQAETIQRQMRNVLVRLKTLERLILPKPKTPSPVQVSLFVSEALSATPPRNTPHAKNVYEAFLLWGRKTGREGAKDVTLLEFNKAMNNLGFQDGKTRGYRTLKGVNIKPEYRI